MLEGVDQGAGDAMRFLVFGSQVNALGRKDRRDNAGMAADDAALEWDRFR